MFRKRYVRLLAVLMVICYFVTASSLASVAQASGLQSGVQPGTAEGSQDGGAPETPEPGEEPGGDPGDPGEPPGEEPGDEALFDEVDNPDGLEHPEEVPAPELFVPNGLELLGGQSMIECDDPGSLTLDKVADPVPGTSNRWNVTLTLEGQDLRTTSDIVLVIDRSGSMEGSRLKAAKTAAKAFVNSLLTTDNQWTRIAVVSFSNDVTVHEDGFKDADEKQSLIGAIDDLTAGGGTHTQAGLRQARMLLASSQADQKVIVL